MAKSKKSFVAYLAVTYGKSGLPSGYKLSPAKKEAEVWAKAPPDTLKKPDASSDEKPEIPDKNNDHSSFLKLMIRSYETMISHYSLISTSISLGKFSTATYLAFDVIKPISDNSEIVSSGDDWKLYGLLEHEVLKLIKGGQRLRQIERGAAALPGASLLSMVAAFDSIIADATKALLKTNPTKLNISDKVISISEIVSSTSLDELIDKVITNEVYDLLRGSHDDQVKFIEKNFNISIREHWKRWSDFIEIFERRNLLAHGEKKFTERYSKICLKHGNSENIKAAGEDIFASISPSYLSNCVDILFEFTILMIFSLWRKHSKGQESEAFEKLNEITYNLIIQGKSVVSERILDFALSLKGTTCDDRTRRMMIVNRANALKKLNMRNDAEKLIMSVDWTATSDNFKICVAAVQDDVKLVVSLMETVKQSNSMSKDAFRDWPVFDGIRENHEFEKEFQKVWGEPLSQKKIERRDLGAGPKPDTDSIH